MAIIMVDAENVNQYGLKGLEYLESRDTLYIFYSKSCCKIERSDMDKIYNSKCGFSAIEVTHHSKNALDFYITAKISELYAQGSNEECIIVSNDKGYRNVVDFWKYNSNMSRLVILSHDIERGLAATRSSNEKGRRIRMQKLTTKLDINEECKKYNIRKQNYDKLYKIFHNTTCSGRIDEIIDFIANHNNCEKRRTYVDATRIFGRNDGTFIYNMIKSLL